MLNTTGLIKLLKINNEGVTKDARHIPFINISAVEWANKDEDKNSFLIVKAFGSTAEYIKRNLNGPRRAMVSGTLTIEKYMAKKTVNQKFDVMGKIQEVPVTVNYEACTTVLIVDSVQFIDKRYEKEEAIVVCNDSSVIVVGDNKSQQVTIVEDTEATTPEPDTNAIIAALVAQGLDISKLLGGTKTQVEQETQVDELDTKNITFK